jgi:peptide/nickel transport system substrate-binding protein
MFRSFVRAFGAVAAATLLAASAQAAELTVGLSTPITSLDPHFHNLTPNNSFGRHVFETLIKQDESQRLLPGLAESWRALNDLEWEIKLRKGVKFHNGSQEFTADDVIATFKRVPNVPNSPASFAFFVRPIVDMQAPDKHTLRLKTASPHPLLPNDLGAVMILPKSIAESAKTEDFNSGKAMIGTGPYRLVEYAAGDRAIVKRNDAYWGTKPAWETVRFKMIPSAPARVAALLAGDVQMIEGVPTADIAKLSKDGRVVLSSAVSNRIIYLHMDSGREKNSPFVTTADGKPLEANPLRDARVRRAISKMIDRDAIVSRIMEGQAVAAGQLLPEQFFGTSKTLEAGKVRPGRREEAAGRSRLPERLRTDAACARTTATSTTRKSRRRWRSSCRATASRPSSRRCRRTSSSRAAPSSSSASCSPAGARNRRNLVAAARAARHLRPEGRARHANRGRFSDPGVDALLTQALTTIDDTKRGIMLARASEKAVGEMMGLIPLHYEVSTWGDAQGPRLQGARRSVHVRVRGAARQVARQSGQPAEGAPAAPFSLRPPHDRPMFVYILRRLRRPCWCWRSRRCWSSAACI